LKDAEENYSNRKDSNVPVIGDIAGDVLRSLENKD
jgi:hypothetical protein